MTHGLIMVVDDDGDSLDMLVSALGGAGYTAVPARDGHEALAKLATLMPDLVLLDALMPGLDGFETCRRIKAATETQHLPVVFMTGLTQTEHVLAGLKAGGVDYVTKPVVIDELLARIAIHLANARATLGARSALDTAGRRLMATGASGQMLWLTPQASGLLAEWASLLPDADAIGQAAARLIAQSGAAPLMAEQPACKMNAGARELDITLLGQASTREYLFRLSETTPGMEQRALQDMLGLTPREAEVLLWISRGKTNRDISEILNISARTVNKHLEQIFVKLGVENRAAAAGIAARIASVQG
ncbi:DNA-binding response regulator [Asticcacaulis sp. EMRT-3]|uniref:DNA-binding response regulator n=1 Tax=Asticcacaulis sp. EMRT-3 TaxID=3040349 RepID=UPI0024AF030D|nr:DNA-binding response regulator [Asticcacaulis sp. EMRT-3]MDI7775658.1 DNA-binding response regulator [Asticcacaulis sp. EMRT-3]